MREYRGRCIGDDDVYGWIEGYYVRLKDIWKNREIHRIYNGFAEYDCGEFYGDYYEVDPETVGRPTGVSDKNGNIIFEGDIVKRHASPMLVKWDDESASFITCYYFHDKYYENTLDGHKNLEIIGNIHDNPELLG